MIQVLTQYSLLVPQDKELQTAHIQLREVGRTQCHQEDHGIIHSIKKTMDLLPSLVLQVRTQTKTLNFLVILVEMEMIVSQDLHHSMTVLL